MVLFIKNSLFMIAIALLLSLAGHAHAAISIEIDPLHPQSIEFGEMSPGEYKELDTPTLGGYYHALVVKNDSGAWQAGVSYDGVLSCGAFTIPRDSFQWMATYAGSKNAPYTSYADGLTLSIAYRSFSESGETFFDSARSSALSAAGHVTTPNGAEIQLKYFLSVPDSQAAGTYRTRIIYTVTQ